MEEHYSICEKNDIISDNDIVIDELADIVIDKLVSTNSSTESLTVTESNETTRESLNFKCPYCRTITNKLLPFIQYTSVHFSKNIHAYAPHCINAIQCSHIIKHRKKNSNDTQCSKNALYYEAENVLFCIQWGIHGVVTNPILHAIIRFQSVFR